MRSGVSLESSTSERWNWLRCSGSTSDRYLACSAAADCGLATALPQAAPTATASTHADQRDQNFMCIARSSKWPPR